ncbi:hypothetical protein ABIA13_006395 [Sinorhizobium fredii]
MCVGDRPHHQPARTISIKSAGLSPLLHFRNADDPLLRNHARFTLSVSSVRRPPSQLELYGTTGLLLDDHGPVTRVPILILTRSQPRSLLSIARSNSARSLIRPSLSRKKRIAQIWRCFRGFLTPTFRPAFQAGRPSAAGVLCNTHLSSPFGHPWPSGKCVSSRIHGAGGGLSALGYRFSRADIGVRCVDGSFVAASGDQIVRASGEPRPCSGGSRRRTSLRDSAPRGQSPASGSRSAPTGARRRRSARRSRSQARHR